MRFYLSDRTKTFNIIAIFLLLLFLTCLEGIFNIGIIQFFFKHIDELLTLIFLFYIICNYQIVMFEKSYLIVLTLAFIFIGIESSILHHYQLIIPTVIDAFLLVDRFIIGYLAVIVYSHTRKKQFSEDVLKAAKVVTILLFLLDIHDIFFTPFFAKSDFRYFMYGLQLMFPHATYLAAASVALLILFGYKNQDNKNLKYMIMTSIVGTSSLREKAIGFFLIYWFFYVVTKYLKIKNFFSLIIIGVILISVVGRKQIMNYFGPNAGYSPRLILTKDSLKLMFKYFPLGTGFGTFGSTMAAQYYSPIYENLGYQYNYGMSSDFTAFLTDSFWPIVFAQFGIIGTLIFILIVTYFVLISIRKFKFNKNAGYAMLMTLIYLLITSVAESSFFNPTAFLFFILFAVYEKEL